MTPDYEYGDQEFESVRARHFTVSRDFAAGALPRLPDAAPRCIARMRTARVARRVTDRLDAMTVGIQHERAVIVGVIVRPKPRRAIVASPTRKRCRVKGIDRGAVGSAKADMCAGDGRPHLGFASDGKFDTGRPWCGTIIGTAALVEINDANESEWTQY